MTQLESRPLDPQARPDFGGLQIIDCDVHTEPGREFNEFLSQEWRQHLALVGLRSTPRGTPLKLAAHPGAIRLDTTPPSGGSGGSDPGFAREQLLDEYGLAAAILSNIKTSSGNMPIGFRVDYARATNDYTMDVWAASDPRWLCSVSTMASDPAWSAAEIGRCARKSDRFVQVLLDPHLERPPGDPRYWPIYEAAAEHELPIAFHVSGRNGDRLSTGVGEQTFYFETRTSLSAYAKGLVSSLIFERVFDHFPTLRIALIELEWTWVVPFSWRLDSTWRVMMNEVPNLKRQPSEYLRDHFWFTTQPAFDPESADQRYEVHDQFEREGFGDRLMFSSDYPHWDMDSPFETTPIGWSRETKRKVLESNAAALYGLSFVNRES